MAEEKATPAEQKPKKISMKMIIVIAGVLLLEGGVISAVFLLRDPAPSAASTGIEDTAEPVNNNLGEIQIAESFQVENYMRGNARTMVTVEVWATYKKASEEESEEDSKVAGLIKARRSEICDRIRMRVASASQNELKDPKLEVMKRIVKSDIESVIGEGLIEEILFPRWSPVDIN